VFADIFSDTTEWRCSFVCVSGSCLQRLDLVPTAAAADSVAVWSNSTALLCNVPPLPPGQFVVRVATDLNEYLVQHQQVTVLPPTLVALTPSSLEVYTVTAVNVTADFLAVALFNLPLRCYVNFTGAFVCVCLDMDVDADKLSRQK
jgi:hypothetical protein